MHKNKLSHEQRKKYYFDLQVLQTNTGTVQLLDPVMELFMRAEATGRR